LDHGPISEGSLLHPSGVDGLFHVSRLKDDADDGNGSATTNDDEIHAAQHGSHVRDFPFSSGLALYILTSNLVGIAQQWYLNRTHPLPAQAPVKPTRGKKS